jgi:hypothetical protein
MYKSDIAIFTRIYKNIDVQARVIPLFILLSISLEVERWKGREIIHSFNSDK